MERPELPLTSKPRRIELHSEALPPLPLLECQWRRLEAVGNASFFTSWHWMGTLLAALPPTSRPKLLRGCANGATVALALLGADDTRRRHGLVRSRGLFVNETGDPRFDALTIEHNGILAAAEWERSIWSELVSWFAGLHGEADELHIGGSLRRLPEAAIHRYGLGCQETSVPSYSVDLSRLQPSGGELYPVLSANARQQLRRAVRHFERFGALRLSEAANTAEAFSFFDAMKRLHCASWERRGKPHSFTGEFFEPFHRLLIERSFDAGGTQLLQVSAGDRVIGYLYNFRLGNRVYAYQSGFDDADSHERPGVVTHFLAIRHAFRSGAQVYDFMAGHNRLKASFATQCEPMLWQIVQQRRLAFRLEHLARRLKQTLVQSH
ncbi:MAG: GNAT family N-acetyltransferase [Alphaproteobacteria bacterium]|nr:GNAT family N-acetyltransferase [Alphaproteobacteria bacterium]